jgi:hypothetical protein
MRLFQDFAKLRKAIEALYMPQPCLASAQGICQPSLSSSPVFLHASLNQAHFTGKYVLHFADQQVMKQRAVSMHEQTMKLHNRCSTSSE